jgi:hypothetical protein
MYGKFMQHVRNESESVVYKALRNVKGQAIKRQEFKLQFLRSREYNCEVYLTYMECKQ